MIFRKVEIILFLHDKVALLRRRRSEHAARKREQRRFRKVSTRYI